MKKYEDLTAEQKAAYDALESDEAKEAYLKEVSEPETPEKIDKETLKSEIIQELQDQDAAKTEKEEKAKKEAAKHQKKRIKEEANPPPQKEEKSNYGLFLSLGFLAVAGYMWYRNKPLNKGNPQQISSTTDNTTVTSSGQTDSVSKV